MTDLDKNNGAIRYSRTCKGKERERGRKRGEETAGEEYRRKRETGKMDERRKVETGRKEREAEGGERRRGRVKNRKKG